MIKGKTAETVWIEFLLDYHRIPSKDEFMDLGYSRATYYRMKNSLPNDYILAEEWVKEHWIVVDKFQYPNGVKLIFKELKEG